MTTATPVPGRPDFQADGLCAQTDPEAFYPDRGESTAPAKRICHACPVEAECLEYALINDERFGVWGGTGPAQRRKLRSERGLPTATTQAQNDRADRARRMFTTGRTKADISRQLRVSGSTLNSYLADQPEAIEGGR